MIPAMSYEAFETFLAAHFWPVLTVKLPVQQPVTDLLFERLRDIELVEAVAPATPPQLRKATLLRTAVLRVPHAAAAIGLPVSVPPPHIHRMQKSNPLWCGDLYSADMLVQALEDASLQFETGANYLDFGCSSGSAVRVMQAAYPDARWHGVDPIASSIEWAAGNLPHIDFLLNDQRPPLPFPSGFFAGVYAISIWSHFSESAAISWFAEMARVIRPGGWLMFTTHGVTALHRHAVRRTKSAQKLRALLLDLVGLGFAFEKIGPQADLEMSEWGNCYFDAGWVARNLSDGWALQLFQPGRNQGLQDVYLLQRSEA